MMRSQSTGLLRTVGMLMLIVGSSVSRSFPQERSSEAWMLDRFGNLRTDDEQARLDRFARELTTHPESTGAIVGYRSTTLPRGQFLRMLWGYVDYLVNSRGILAANLTVVEGGFKQTESYELWIAPAEARPPAASWKPGLVERIPVLFDDFSTTETGYCIGEYSIYLYKPDDAFRFFAEALKTDPDAKAAIVIHPALRENRAKGTATARASTDSLIRLGISPQRILTTVGKRYSPRCTDLNLWLAPGSKMKADEVGYYKALMQKAEETEYTVRRVEFTGNTHIRDRTLRKQFVQQEGDVFSKKLLLRSLNNFSRLGLVYPVTFDDVAVRLADEDKLIDITIFFRERPRAWRRVSK